MDIYDTIVIGSGPAGYTAAIYAVRAGLTVVCIEGYAAGGQLLLTDRVHNFPGFPEGIDGPDLMQRMRDQAGTHGAELVTRDVTAVDLSGPPFVVQARDLEFRGRSVIVATGAAAKQLGLPSEAALQTKGVAYCAICDGPFFAGQRVAVVGGGDGAMEAALWMSKLASEVVVVHRRTELRASQAMQSHVAARPNVTLVTPFTVEEVLGEDAGRVTGLCLRHTETGERRIEELHGVFVSIGHTPSTELFLPWLDHDPAGYLRVEGSSTRTSVPGVFAAGDVADACYRQAVTAAGSGCMAALDAERWLALSESAGEEEAARWAA